MKTIIQIIKEIGEDLPKFPDGRIDYSSSYKAPVIVVFVKYKNKILLLKRSDKVSTYKGKWQTVAGYLDEIKPIKEKVLEELKEEISISENDFKEVKYGQYFEYEDKNLGRTWIVQPCLVELSKQKEIKIDWEHTEFVWVNPNGINKYDIVPNVSLSLKRVLG